MQSQPEFRRTGSKEKIRRNNDTRPEFNRGGSRDNVRKIVEKEGKIARNLVAWSVPSEKGMFLNKLGEINIFHVFFLAKQIENVSSFTITKELKIG